MASSDLAALSEDWGFWEAQEATNQELSALGLYITHLFRADQVFLRSSWENHLLPVSRPKTRWLRLFRPASIDLVLTKMMRGSDPQDMADAEFLIKNDRISLKQMEEAFTDLVMPDMIELRDAFRQAVPVILKLAEKHGG